MIDPKSKAIIKEWEKIGLNIYLSSPISHLSPDLLSYFEKNQIDLSLYKSIVLLGNGGRRFGQNFKYPLEEKENPIDSFSLKQIETIHSPLILYPSEKYIPPLQKISRFFEFSHQSPLGLDISKDFGLWFAFRVLFLSKEEMPQTHIQSHQIPCKTCEDKKCLSSCPANATSLTQFNLKECASYRLTDKSSCHDRCHARLACPYKIEHQYELNQIQYHMTRERHLIKLSDFK